MRLAGESFKLQIRKASPQLERGLGRSMRESATRANAPCYATKSNVRFPPIHAAKSLVAAFDPLLTLRVCLGGLERLEANFQLVGRSSNGFFSGLAQGLSPVGQDSISFSARRMSSSMRDLSFQPSFVIALATPRAVRRSP